jgi:uncharacterized protein
VVEPGVEHRAEQHESSIERAAEARAALTSVTPFLVICAVLRIKAFLKATPLKLTTTWPVLTEVCALLPQLPAFDFMDFACRGGVDVEDPDAADLSAMLVLSRKYSDVPMDFADASLVVLAMKRGVDVIVSLDLDFDIYRLAYKKSFENLLSSLRRR